VKEPSVQKLLALLETLMKVSPHIAVSDVASDLDELGIEYCVIGGVSLAPYNFTRETGDIDILISKKSFPLLKKLIGHGYTRRPGSTKNMHFHIGNSRIKIDILVEGDKEKDFTMPNPVKIRNRIHSIWYINIKNLVEFKLRSSRPQDLADVARLIDHNFLPVNYLSGSDLEQKYQEIFKSLSV
jgi:predicted nucleotidyltransferase